MVVSGGDEGGRTLINGGGIRSPDGRRFNPNKDLHRRIRESSGINSTCCSSEEEDQPSAPPPPPSPSSLPLLLPHAPEPAPRLTASLPSMLWGI